MSMQPGGFLPGLEPQGPDSRRFLTPFVVLALAWVLMTYFAPKPPPTPAAAPDAPAAVAGGASGWQADRANSVGSNSRARRMLGFRSFKAGDRGRRRDA